MKRTAPLLLALTLLAPRAGAIDSPQETAERVHLDARVIQRVAEVSGRDLPSGILTRILDEDIDLLRGRQSDGTYLHAHFEKIPAGQIDQGFTVGEGREGRLDRSQLRAKHVYELRIAVPSRRLLVARNRRVWVDRVDLDYTSVDGQKKFEEIILGEWIEPGKSRTVPFAEIAADAVVTVYARAENKSANMELRLIKADLVDNADSPWFGAVQNAKLLRTAIERNDVSGVQSFATTLASRLARHVEPAVRVEEPAEPALAETRLPPVPEPPSRPGPLRPPGAEPSIEPPPVIEIYFDLQRIEDLLTGTETERREGMDRLHQLVRRLRSSSMR